MKNQQILTDNIGKVYLIGLLFCTLFALPLYDLVHVWMREADYSHGFFVIPITIYMLWQKRERLMGAEAQVSWLGFGILLLGLFFYLVGIVTSFHTMTYLSMVLSISGLCIYVLGWKTAGLTMSAVLFLIFMFPIPSSVYIMVTNPLKLIITDISCSIIHLFGIPVLREGNLLFFTNTQLEVAEACSGMRSIYSYLMLSIVFTLFCKSRLTKAVLILSVIPLAMLVNIIRVSGTGILSHHVGPAVAQGFFHEFAGFVLFAVGLVLLYGIYLATEKIQSKQKERSTAQ